MSCLRESSTHEDSQPRRVTRLNWSGLGVVDVEGRERCVPLTRIGDEVRVRWRYGDWGQVIGERLDEPHRAAQLDEDLGCAQARRCSGCALRHLDPQEQRAAQEESHLGAITRLSGRDLSMTPSSWLEGPQRDGYRARVRARLMYETTSKQWRLALRPRWGEPVRLSKCPNHPELLRSLVETVEAWLNERAQDYLPPAPSSEIASQGDALSLPSRDLFELSSVSVQAGEGLPMWVTLHLEAPRKEGSLKRQERERRLSVGVDQWEMLPLDDLQERLNDITSQVFGGVTLFGVVSLRDQGRSSIGPAHLSGPLVTRWRCSRGLSFEAAPPAWLPQTPSTLEAVRRGVDQLIWGRDGDVHHQVICEIGCGVGLVSVALLLDHPETSWIGVDIEPMSTRCAEESARINGVAERARWIAADGRRALAALDEAPDTLIIHAMRRPMSGLLNLAAHRGVRRVCYLAPSAPSLGRDLAESEQYRLEELIYLDQMPGTATLMTMALLSLDVDAAPLTGEDSTRA